MSDSLGLVARDELIASRPWGRCVVEEEETGIVTSLGSLNMMTRKTGKALS
jgi:hypothetical protein